MGVNPLKWKPLFTILLGLLMLGGITKNVGAYQDLGSNTYTTTVSYFTSSARVDEMIFLYGESPRILAGTQQTLIISSFTGIDNEPLCHLSSGCFVPRNKYITVYQVQDSGPTDVEYELWWVGDNDGSGVPSEYAALINAAVDYMIDKIADYIPYADLVIDFVKLLTRQDYSESGPQLITSPSFSRYIGDHVTGGMIIRVKPTDTGELEPGEYTYRIGTLSRTEIWFYEHSSWVLGEDIKEELGLQPSPQPLDTSKYIGAISVSREYTLTVVKNW